MKRFHLDRELFNPIPATTPPLQQQLPTAPTPTNIGGCESALRFLLLPSQVAIVLLLEFLNSFRSFGLRFVMYNYITNEFGIDDTRAGELLGIKGFMDIGFGLAGSILVDIFGVRKVSIAALSVAIVVEHYWHSVGQRVHFTWLYFSSRHVAMHC